MEFRKPFALEEKHFIEIVTHFQKIQVETGLPQAKKLRAEVVRFGYKASKDGLRVYCGDPEVEIDDEAVEVYLELIQRVMRSDEPNAQ